VNDEPQQAITQLENGQRDLMRWLYTAHVTNPTEKRNAEDMLIVARVALKEAVQKRMELTRPLDEAKARIIALFKPYVQRLEDGIDSLTRELNTYHAHLLQIQAIEHERALKEQAERLKEALKTGEVVDLVEPTDVPVVAKTSRANLGTVTYRDDFDIEIVDPNKVPRDLCDPNMSKIRARVKSGVTDIPGVLVTRKHVPVTRR
jgi:hypothetical protein